MNKAVSVWFLVLLAEGDTSWENKPTTFYNAIYYNNVIVYSQISMLLHFQIWAITVNCYIIYQPMMFWHNWCQTWGGMYTVHSIYSAIFVFLKYYSIYWYY